MQILNENSVKFSSKEDFKIRFLLQEIQVLIMTTFLLYVQNIFD